MADAQSGSKQVLLAEDDPIIRDMIQQFLHSWGYGVLSACNGREAMEFADKHKGELDLLVSDVIMPEMDGLELAERLSAKRPGLQVILLSGYSHTHLVLQRDWKFIQKPFRSQELKAAVEDSLQPKSDLCSPGSHPHCVMGVPGVESVELRPAAGSRRVTPYMGTVAPSWGIS